MGLAPDGAAAGWQPENALEVALGDALHQGDHDAYGRLLGAADLVLPLPDRTQEGGSAPGWTTWTVDGRVHVLAFTSAHALRSCLPEHAAGHRTVSCSRLAAEWPSEEWWLAVDPGLPIEAYLPWWFVEQIGRRRPPRQPEPPVSHAPSAGPAGVRAPGGFEPAGPTEAALLAAATADDVEAYLRTLLSARVLVPVSGTTPQHATVGDPGFDWLTLLFGDDNRALPVFTSPGLLPPPLATARTVPIEVVDLVRGWTGGPWPLAVNPGTPIGMLLPPEQVSGLAGWLTHAVPGLADGPRDGTVVMQKLLPADQLDRYLTRGHDRVAGIVHRAAELADLDTPAALLAATTGSASAAVAEPANATARASATGPGSGTGQAVYVIRWAAYRWRLYQAVDHPAPRVPAFSVASVRLPHGAELYRFAAAAGGPGEESLMAVFDADQRRWRTSGETTVTGGADPARTPGSLPPDGYVARVGGADFEASPDGEFVRLYSAGTAEGYVEVAPDRHRAVVPLADVDELRYLRTRCRWKGEPFLILEEDGGWLRVEYDGDTAGVPARLRLEQVDGAHQGWAPRHELTDVTQARI